MVRKEGGKGKMAVNWTSTISLDDLADQSASESLENAPICIHLKRLSQGAPAKLEGFCPKQVLEEDRLSWQVEELG